MKALEIFRERYWVSIFIISAVVGVLVHFPELLSLAGRFGPDTLFPGIRPLDVLNEIVFTFISLLVIFGTVTLVFRFNSACSRIGVRKILLSFVTSLLLSSLLGQLFVLLHRQFDIPAVDAMLHHYLHPLRDFIVACIVTGSSYLIHILLKQEQMAVENQLLRTESIRNQYEALKSQLNPHMLFNSLNTLQSLIRECPDRAIDYTRELSRVLRYTLQCNDSMLVSLREELKFAEAYIFLMKMRYEENLRFEIKIGERYMDCLLPPVSIQILIENAVKHNEISNMHPLSVIIGVSGGRLFVSNRIQPRLAEHRGAGVGLENLSKRYRLLMQQEVEIMTDNGLFQVFLPLQKNRISNESSSHRG